MRHLSREEFVHLCTQAIINTRDKIAIRNQLSGYTKYHHEIKNNNYFLKNVRGPLQDIPDDNHQYKHDYIEYVGLGNCEELANYLLIEIGKAINESGAVATIRIAKSKRFDHGYLEINIQLQNERTSRWEVDAWDPRVIDISKRNDGTIKNNEVLCYGYAIEDATPVYTNEIDYKARYTFFHHPKPKPGTPSRQATPEPEMLAKHPDLHRDYPIKEAIEEGKIAPDELHYLQRVSNWQRY